MSFALDHLLLFTDQDAPAAAQRLIDFGLTEGARNFHPGQGTANRRFFFHNAFLELLWVDDPPAAQGNAAGARLRLWERWDARKKNASPFGICLRPAKPESTAAHFSTWEYRPAYLPPPLTVQVGENSDNITEPLLFTISFGRRADSLDESQRQPLWHSPGWKEITRVRIVGPGNSARSEFWCAVVEACPWLSLAVGDAPVMELGLDGESTGQSVDFRPEMPLVCFW